MKKCFLLTLFSVLLLVACVKDESFGKINTRSCQDIITRVNIKTMDAYSQNPVPNQRFRLKVLKTFGPEQTLKEVVTSASGEVSFYFEQDPKAFNVYSVVQVVDTGSYVALSWHRLSTGCINDIDFSMKKVGVLSLTLKNESTTAHGKCQLNVSVAFRNRQITIDTFPVGYSKTFEVIKLHEELVTMWLHDSKTDFKQQETLRADKSTKESYTMVIR